MEVICRDSRREAHVGVDEGQLTRGLSTLSESLLELLLGTSVSLLSPITALDVDGQVVGLYFFLCAIANVVGNVCPVAQPVRLAAVDEEEFPASK